MPSRSVSTPKSWLARWRSDNGGYDGRQGGGVRYFSNQTSDQTVINYSYTQNPLKLLAWDAYYFFVFLKELPNIILPMQPCDSGELDELAFTRGNLHCIFIHSILVVLQLAFIFLLPPVALLIPLWMTILITSSFLVVNQALCRLLNGPTLDFVSDPEFAHPDQSRYKNEQWVFLNGVAVGSHWMKNNLNRLALTFGREVIGIHNRTDGIIFDVIECLIQRNFNYATNDIRMAYQIIRRKLYSAKYNKVVFILHSQGGIEGGMVLDWLLQDVPQNLMEKLEVYTFGSAANHCNNPYRTVESQAHVEHRELLTTEGTKGAIGLAPLSHRMGEEYKQLLSSINHHNRGKPLTPPISPLFKTKHESETMSSHRTTTSTTMTTMSSSTSTGTHESHIKAIPGSKFASTESVRAISFMEHYAFTTDFVALWGVLHFATSKPASDDIPRFSGHVFECTDPAKRGGHQFC